MNLPEQISLSARIIASAIAIALAIISFKLTEVRDIKLECILQVNGAAGTICIKQNGDITSTISDQREASRLFWLEISKAYKILNICT